jgi:hypothetical protein
MTIQHNTTETTHPEARFPRAEALLQILELAAVFRRLAARLDHVTEDESHDLDSARSAAIAAVIGGAS